MLVPVATLRETQKQMTRTLLLDVSLRLFESQGYALTTVDEIAKAAGTTRTTFYQHFSSKAEVMHGLLERVRAILTTASDPELDVVVETGERELIRRWLDTKFDQWPTIRPYLLATAEAAPSDPGIAEAVESWFSAVTTLMREGLDRADRFDAESRSVRCLLAFGQLEFLAQRWYRHGWIVPRETCLETLTDAWCHLLAGAGAGLDGVSAAAATGRA